MQYSPKDTVIMPLITVEKYKQKARKLKKELGIPHHDALERVAKDTGYFQNWHQIIHCYKQTKITEDAYREGLIIAFEWSNAADIFLDENAVFEIDEQASSIIETDIRCYVENFVEHDTELNPSLLPNKELLTPEELEKDLMEEIQSLVFYRYIGKNSPTGIEQTIALCHDFSFWGPEYEKRGSGLTFDIFIDLEKENIRPASSGFVKLYECEM